MERRFFFLPRRRRRRRKRRKRKRSLRRLKIFLSSQKRRKKKKKKKKKKKIHEKIECSSTFYLCEEKRNRSRSSKLLTSSILQLQQISIRNRKLETGGIYPILSWIESLAWLNLMLLYYLLGRCSPSDEGKSLTSCHQSCNEGKKRMVAGKLSDLTSSLLREIHVLKSNFKIFFFLNIHNESRYLDTISNIEIAWLFAWMNFLTLKPSWNIDFFRLRDSNYSRMICRWNREKKKYMYI